MPKPTELTALTPEKQPLFASDKVLVAQNAPNPDDSLIVWAETYFRLHVDGAPEKTVQAKKNDLGKFLRFFTEEVGSTHMDAWTPAVTRHFQNGLMKTRSPKTGEVYRATTVNRVMATVRHFGRWLHRERPLKAGNPLESVKDIGAPESAWNGLTDRQIMRLKSAVDVRLMACNRKNQNPLLEAAVFYTLLHTGLRESELVGLSVGQYHHRMFHQVYRRKGRIITEQVPVPKDAQALLDRYLATREAVPSEPLFLSRYGNRLGTRDVERICERILRQACAQLAPEERFHLTPHMLRHTFLKRAADKHGIHYAQTMSGNVSMREVFRYTKPSIEEIERAAEEVYG